MIYEKGEVVSEEGEFVRVRIYRESACGGNCADCGGCGKKEHIVYAKNPSGAKKGDRVRVLMHKNKILKAAFLAYIFPLFALIAGYCAIYAITKKELISAFLSLVIMIFSFVILHFYDKKVQDKYRPVAQKELKEEK